jgi:hypothetical protein
LYNGNEEGVDCGGLNCAPCVPEKKVSLMVVATGGSVFAVVCVMSALLIRKWYRRRQSAVAPMNAGSKIAPRQVRLVDAKTRKITFGKQKSERARRFSGITPSTGISIDWMMHEQRQTIVGKKHQIVR